MKKKLTSLALAIMMIISIMPMSLAADSGLENFEKTNTYTPGMFLDVLSSDWYAESVIAAYQFGLVKGTTATNFNPKGNITVAETIALASRLHSIYNNGSAEFTQGAPWYQVYVDYALANKIIPGTYSDYNAKITRLNFAKIISNALPGDALKEINNIANGNIPDVPSETGVYKLYRAGVLTGNDKYGTFNPNSTILRCEVATIVTRMADRTQRKMFMLEKKPLEPESVTLAGNTSIKVGETTKWTATVAPSEANQWVSWNSGNPGVATVDANGNIKGLKAGQSNITATAVNGVKKTVLVTVVSPHQIHYAEFPGVPDYGKIFGIEGHKWHDEDSTNFTYQANSTYGEEFEVYKKEKERVLYLHSLYIGYLRQNGFEQISNFDTSDSGYWTGGHISRWYNRKLRIDVLIMIRYDGLATIIQISKGVDSPW